MLRLGVAWSSISLRRRHAVISTPQARNETHAFCNSAHVDLSQRSSFGHLNLILIIPVNYCG